MTVAVSTSGMVIHTHILLHFNHVLLSNELCLFFFLLIQPSYRAFKSLNQIEEEIVSIGNEQVSFFVFCVCRNIDVFVICPNRCAFLVFAENSIQSPSPPYRPVYALKY